MDKTVVDIIKNAHVLDIILMLTIMGFAFLGFSRGMVKLAIILGSIYFGFVIGAIYYVPMADVIAKVMNVSLSAIAQIIAYLLINVVVAGLLIGILFQFFGHLEIQGRTGACVDRPVGMILGFITGIILTAILVNLMAVPYEINNQARYAGDQAPYLVIFNTWYAESWMRGPLHSILPALLASVSPFLGGRVPSLLNEAAQGSFAPMLPPGVARLQRLKL
jgi:uncharacterized membrane protein required for colicin V production